MIVSRERYSQLCSFLNDLISSSLSSARPSLSVNIEDALELDIPLDTLQSLHAQLLKRRLHAVLGSGLYANDVMRRVLLAVVESVSLAALSMSDDSNNSNYNNNNNSSSYSNTETHRTCNSSDNGAFSNAEAISQCLAVIEKVIGNATQSQQSYGHHSNHSNGRGGNAYDYDTNRNGNNFNARQHYSNTPSTISHNHNNKHFVPAAFPSSSSAGYNNNFNKSTNVQNNNSQMIFNELQRLITLCPYNLANLYLKMKYPNNSNLSVGKFLTHSTVITDPMTRSNMFYLIGHDCFNAPDIDMMKELVGKEYEEMLERMLKKRHMEFETEDDSRRKGRQKTPDILFTIPMAVKVSGMFCATESIFGVETRSNRSESFDMFVLGSNYPSDESLISQQEDNASPVKGRSNNQRGPADSSYLIVNWIDSKALFADMETFEENLVQFRTYINRFGRGMVIYWQGYCEEILSHSALSMNEDLLICDSFPEDWLFPTGEPADGRRPLFDDINLPSPPSPRVNQTLDK